MLGCQLTWEASQTRTSIPRLATHGGIVRVRRGRATGISASKTILAFSGNPVRLSNHPWRQDREILNAFQRTIEDFEVVIYSKHTGRHPGRRLWDETLDEEERLRRLIVPRHNFQPHLPSFFSVLQPSYKMPHTYEVAATETND